MDTAEFSSSLPLEMKGNLLANLQGASFEAFHHPRHKWFFKDSVMVEI